MMDRAPSPAVRDEIPLPAPAPGTRRVLTVLRFGEPGARPKAYLQAGLHADEFPGMVALRHLAEMLEARAAAGEILGEIIVLPLANPVGFAQQVGGFLHGRHDLASFGNFNRDYPDLAADIADGLGENLTPDAAANVATIRAAMGAALAERAPRTETAALRHHLLSLAYDADIVLDIHADNQAMPHLYVGTPLWPDARDLAGDIEARAVLLAEISGGHPFDEACSGPWWSLAARFPDVPIPPACFAATLELGSNDDVDEREARRTAEALLRFLARRGLVGGVSDLAPAMPRAEATPLDAMQQLIAPVGGLVAYHARLGDHVRTGDLVARIIDPVGGAADVLAGTDGILFARHSQTYAWPGKVIGKIAGEIPLPERKGELLTD